jgi:predicted GNAT family N-acyltransferase
MSEDPNENGRRRILGYYTVAMSSFDISAMPESHRRGLPGQVPAALLARLAVDRSAQGEGLGRTLLVDALQRISKASQEVSAHAVVLDAVDDDAKAFYLPYGFLELTDDPLRLFLPMASVRKIVG